MDAERCARELDALAPLKAGTRMGELVDATRDVLALIPPAAPEQLVSAYRRYLDGGGDRRFALPWLRADGIGDTGGAAWCLAHELHRRDG